MEDSMELIRHTIKMVKGKLKESFPTIPGQENGQYGILLGM